MKVLKPAAWLSTGVVALLVAMALLSSAGLDASCAGCHAATALATSNSPHSTTGCFACHAPTPASRLAFGWVQVTRMLPAQLTGSRSPAASSPIPRTACLECHDSVYNGVVAGTSGVRIDHSSCAPTGSCDACHSATAHGAVTRGIREPVMERCTACHTLSGASLACDECHVGRAKKERLAVGPWQTTHGRTWRNAHGMGDLISCGTCHPTDYCVRCHGVPLPHPSDFGGTHGRLAVKNSRSCNGCHKSTNFCDGCHGIVMPHPSSFLGEHSKIADGVQDSGCARCHDVADCNYCHVRHVHPGGASAGSSAPQQSGVE